MEFVVREKNPGPKVKVAVNGEIIVDTEEAPASATPEEPKKEE